MKKYNIVDLFCGAGGGSIGVKRHNRTNTLFALDFWKPAVDSYNYNLGNKALNIDIHNLSEKKIKELIGDNKCDIVLGSPPCQGFSLQSRYKYKQCGEYHEGMEQKNHLFLEFLRVVNILKPEVVVMENVKGILSMKNKNKELILDNIIKAYNEIGYYVKYKIIECEKLGLPQTRHRVIFLASRDKNLFDMLEYPQYRDKSVSIKEAIMDIPEKDNTYLVDVDNTTDYIKSLRNKNDILIDNVTNNTSKIVKDRIKLIKTGMYMGCLPEGHPLKTKAKFTNSYKRENENNLLGTMSNICKTMLIHPKYSRIYTIREGMRLQNFPDNFILQGTIQEKYLMVANAIPPILTEKVFENVFKILDNYYEKKLIFKV